jgi:putative salt-induced outer membrane protein YdiY
MRFAPPVVLALLVAAHPSLAQEKAAPADPAAAAAAAAQRAAEAAEKAAEAAARSAAAVEKLVPAAAAPTAPAAPPAGPAPKGPPPPAWTGLVSLGLIALTGNSESLSFKLTSAFDYKGPEWIWGIRATAVYGQARNPGQTESQVNALGATFQARGDRRFSEALSAYLLAGIDTDHVKSIESRPYGEAGVSLIWWDSKEKDGFQKSLLRTDLGFRYGHEYRFQYYGTPADPTVHALPGVDIVAPHGGANLRYAINKDIIFTQDVDAVGNLVGTARLLLTATSKLAARLTAATSLGIAFAVSYDSVPPPNKLGTDTALTVSLDIAL